MYQTPPEIPVHAPRPELFVVGCELSNATCQFNGSGYCFCESEGLFFAARQTSHLIESEYGQDILDVPPGLGMGRGILAPGLDL